VAQAQRIMRTNTNSQYLCCIFVQLASSGSMTILTPEYLANPLLHSYAGKRVPFLAQIISEGIDNCMIITLYDEQPSLELLIRHRDFDMSLCGKH
jgi:hypothetical protein